MAKQKSTKASKKDLSVLVKVTEQNKKFCLKIGRKLYAYKTTGETFVKIGEFEYRPRLKKGWMKIDGKSVNISEDEDRTEYLDGMRAVINLLMKKEQLYINSDEPLIIYEQK